MGMLTWFFWRFKVNTEVWNTNQLGSNLRAYIQNCAPISWSNMHMIGDFGISRRGYPSCGSQTMGQEFMGLNLLPTQFIHQTKAYALQNEEKHVNKPVSVNLAVSQWDLLRDSFSVFSSKKVARRARSARRATFLLTYTPQRAISLIIHELSCKIFHFFSFLLTFGGWDCNHFVPNFMGNNSIKNFKA